jgi:hypothetical protein
MDVTIAPQRFARQRRLADHAPAIARRLLELAARLEARGEPVDVLDGLALRNIAAILAGD